MFGSGGDALLRSETRYKKQLKSMNSTDADLPKAVGAEQMCRK
jgi:hypothetical protein